ncbi:MAG: hypothetical protein ACPL88_04560, partial [Bryobacteraceae bacterium]
GQAARLRQLPAQAGGQLDGIELPGAAAVGAVDQEVIVLGERLRLEVAAMADRLAFGDLP